MKLLFATGNKFKFELMKRRLSIFEELELISPKDLDLEIDVVEDGKTAGENAYKKAMAYFNATKLPTIAEDSGLYIDKFTEEEQPGLFVRRINGKDDLSDEEIFEYYYNKILNYGGESTAHYFSGVALVDLDGTVHSTIFNERDFLLTTNLYKDKSFKGGVLEPMSYDLNAKKYFDERTSEEEEYHYKKLNEGYRKLVKKYVIDRANR